MITLLLLVRATYVVLFFAHIPFVVNRAFNATPTEKLQHYEVNVAFSTWKETKRSVETLEESEKNNRHALKEEIANSLTGLETKLSHLQVS